MVRECYFGEFGCVHKISLPRHEMKYAKHSSKSFTDFFRKLLLLHCRVPIQKVLGARDMHHLDQKFHLSVC